MLTASRSTWNSRRCHKSLHFRAPRQAIQDALAGGEVQGSIPNTVAVLPSCNSDESTLGQAAGALT